MSTQYVAFIAKSRLPPTAELSRAMSSRGWAVALDTEQKLFELGGTLPLTVDGQAVPVQITVESVADAGVGEVEADEAVVHQVLKNTDTRLVFSAEGDAARWARDVARAVGLLACGAFANPQDGRLINFGR